MEIKKLLIEGLKQVVVFYIFHVIGVLVGLGMIISLGWLFVQYLIVLSH